MPNGRRIRANNVFGTIFDNPLAPAATSMNSNQLVLLPAVVNDHAVITLDPIRQYGDPEIIIVTAHTPASTVATIQRGAYGTIAREHPQDTVWVHALLDEDTVKVLTSSTRPTDPYEGQMIYEMDTDFYVGYNGSTWERLLAPAQWSTYTPTITQSGNVSFNATYARYQRIGRTVAVQALLVMDGVQNGTGSNNISVTLPVPFRAAYITAGSRGVVGSGNIFDSSVAINYPALISPLAATTQTVIFRNTATNGVNTLGGAVMTAGLNVNDEITFSVIYEGAT